MYSHMTCTLCCFTRPDTRVLTSPTLGPICKGLQAISQQTLPYTPPKNVLKEKLVLFGDIQVERPQNVFFGMHLNILINLTLTLNLTQHSKGLIEDNTMHYILTLK